MRSILGNTIFKILRKKVIERLKNENYEILENVRLEDGTQINFIGIKDGKKFGVDIYIRPNKKKIQEKEKKFSKYLTDFVFAVPIHAKYYKPDKIWEFDVLKEIDKAIA